jgi:hypothetical protein
MDTGEFRMFIDHGVQGSPVRAEVAPTALVLAPVHLLPFSSRHHGDATTRQDGPDRYPAIRRTPSSWSNVSRGMSRATRTPAFQCRVGAGWSQTVVQTSRLDLLLTLERTACSSWLGEQGAPHHGE